MTVKRIFSNKKTTAYKPEVTIRTLKILRKDYTPNGKVVTYLTRYGHEAMTVIMRTGRVAAYIGYKHIGYYDDITEAKKAIIKKEYGA